jgi:hypothetical protein
MRILTSLDPGDPQVDLWTALLKSGWIGVEW